MEKERDGEAKLQGLALAEGLQRHCWASSVSLVAGGMWVGNVGCSKAEDTSGLFQGLLPCGIAGLSPWQGTLQPCSEGKGAGKLGFSPVKSYWALPSAGGESWGCYGCGARPSDPCVGTHIKDQGHMSIIKPGDIRVDVLGISKIKQQGGRWGGREGWRGKKNRKKTFKSFLETKQKENKRNHPKTKPGRRNAFDFQNWHPLL